MNALARVALAENTFTKGVALSFSFSELKVILLLGLCLLSALGIIYANDLNRRLMIIHSKLLLDEEELQLVNHKLLLERGCWSAQARVQVIARDNLQMQLPRSSEIIMIKV